MAMARCLPLSYNSLTARASPITKLRTTPRCAPVLARSRSLLAPARALSEDDKDDKDAGQTPPKGMVEVSRREFGLGAVGNIAIWGVWGYIGYDLIQDLGYSFGDNAKPVPEYEGIQGVGTKYKVAAFAGGCFWCMEGPFDRLGDGVLATISGYTGGVEENPSYRQVSANATGHLEAVQVVYDPSLVSYEQLLDAFWHNVNPTQENGQFVDIGPQYTTAIFAYDEQQAKAARASKANLQAAGVYGADPIVTPIRAATAFWNAERYHQDYYKTHSTRYGFYRGLSGRDEYIQEIWGPDYLMSTKKH